MKTKKYYLLITDNHNAKTDFTELKAKSYNKALKEAEEVLVAKFEDFRFEKDECGMFTIKHDPSKATLLNEYYSQRAYVIYCKTELEKEKTISDWKEQRQKVLEKIVENTEKEELERLKNKYDRNKGVQNKEELSKLLFENPYSEFVIYNLSDDKNIKCLYPYKYKEQKYYLIEEIERLCLENNGNCILKWRMYAENGDVCSEHQLKIILK